MKKLTSQHIYLRSLEPEDLDYIYQIENDTELWELSQTQTPYSRYLIKQYLQNAHQDIYEAKQIRFVIVLKEDDSCIGLIDLFDFDPKNERVGLGILISDPNQRTKGYAQEAVELIKDYVFEILHCYQIYVNIQTDNLASISLFSKFGFECVGVKKAWNRVGDNRKDEALYQLIKK